MSPIPKPVSGARRLAWLLASAVAPLLAAPAAQAQTPLSFYAVAPCRLFDTRSSPPKIPANTSRAFPVRGVCGVPASAQAVAVNVTVVACTDFGNLRVYPAGIAAPLASWLNFTGGGEALANGGIVRLGESAGSHLTLEVNMPVGSSGQCHALADVSGFFQ